MEQVRWLKLDQQTQYTLLKLLCLMEFLETSDCTDGSRKDETCLQFKMKKYYINTWKISDTPREVFKEAYRSWEMENHTSYEI